MPSVDTQTSPCLSCNFCMISHPGPKPPDSPCTPWMQKVHQPLNPVEYQCKKKPLSLYAILRTITPKELWKKWLKALNPYAFGGYRKETHERLRLKDCPKPKETRLSTPKPPWWQVKRGVKAQVELQTPAPRITTIAHHGPRSLLHPFFPEMEEVPKDFKLSISAERADEMVKAQRATRLAGAANLSLGGRGKGRTIADLEGLKSPAMDGVATIEDTEPLRAMSFREVTNIPLLIDYTGIQRSQEGEEEEDG